MADTWPVGDAMERGTGAGGLMAFARGFANAVGAGASNGFGLGDASSGMAGGAGQGSQIRQGFADRIKTGAQDAVLSQYPGRGVLWEYGADGVQCCPLGYAAGAAAVLVLLLVLGGAVMVDWQMVASVFCMIAASLVAVIYGQISHALTRISARLDDLARLVHGHEIRINMLDDDYGR